MSCTAWSIHGFSSRKVVAQNLVIAGHDIVRIRRKINVTPTLVVSLTIIGAWAFLSLFAPLVARYDPLAQQISIALRAPSFAHLFGTDQLGRDVFARVVYGGRTTLPAAMAVVAIGSVFGTFLGAIAGYSRRWIDEFVMRLTDIFLAFPVVILAMAVAGALGPGVFHGLIALAIAWWPNYARVARGMVREIKVREYVVASRAAGRQSGSILLRVILPNALPPLLVMTAVDTGRAILMFAVLSFLGLGATPPAPDWGYMAAEGAQAPDSWWIATAPALAILSLVFAFNFAGDSVRDAMDPLLRGRR
jgi:peptide/nickel transport system permease protein